MAHRLYKSIIPSTNRQNPQRDLTVFENMAQGIRFTFEVSKDEGLGSLRGLGLFDNVYFESNTDLLARYGHDDECTDDDCTEDGIYIYCLYSLRY